MNILQGSGDHQLLSWHWCYSQSSMGCSDSTECNRIGPDYFGFYSSEVAEVLSQSEDFLPFSDQILVNSAAKKENNSYDAKGYWYTSGSAPLFSDCFGSHVSEFRKERLKLLLRQSIVPLSGEVDEVMDPVFSICQLQSCLRYKESLLVVPGAASDSDQGQHPQKKLKSCHLSDSEREDLIISTTGGDTSNDVVQRFGGKAKDPLPMKDQKEVGSSVGAASENGDVSDDLQFLLQNDSSKVEHVMKKYSDEVLATLGHMEEKLEELLDTVMSNCRLMTLPEKHNLRRLIQNLPPRNLDRVVEILCRRKQVEKHSCSEVFVDFENEDNATLWRLYFYIETVENAKKLSDA